MDEAEAEAVELEIDGNLGKRCVRHLSGDYEDSEEALRQMPATSRSDSSPIHRIVRAAFSAVCRMRWYLTSSIISCFSALLLACL